MSVKLRLMRVGKKKQPSYRIVASDSHSPRDGRFIEIVGTYAPRAEPSVINLDNDKALSWLEKGAQPTETVRKLLEISGAWATFSAAHPKASVVTKKGTPAKTAAPKAEAAKAEAPKVPAAAAPAAKATPISEEPSADEVVAEVAADEVVADEAAAESADAEA
ncbi:MAG TPA: 30S ribosomal protein S16 [Acidimicrobiales bacterium]|nr:30S ribosomal protein S16 [Acidimicrobiales bacterium]